MACWGAMDHRSEDASLKLSHLKKEKRTIHKRNFVDKAARALAMPIPRRKAFKYLATGFGGACLSFLWPKRATAYDYDPQCNLGGGVCSGRLVDDGCSVNGQPGHCAILYKSIHGKYCQCVPGPAPDAPNISSIPEVAITREDSLASGNCEEGTDYVLSWFPGTHSVSAREAAKEAIARGKPRLARYIARTAHLVHRNAQV
jgi:hypothetical protein